VQAILNALGEQHGELAALLEPLDDGGWASPTRCEGWSVADVVLHLAQTDEFACASLDGRLAEASAALDAGWENPGDVDDAAGAMVAHERGLPNAALLERWSATAGTLRTALAAGDPHRRVRWVRGELSIHTLTATRLAECWIHTGDVAEAVGVEPVATDRLEHIARLAWRTLPYAFARAGRELAGPVELDLVAPSGARWHFVPDTEPLTRIEGAGADLCLIAARRVAPEDTSLRGTGPDARAVLELMRTYA
jgi:uncharacterized protein (TIGR03084 family)